MSRRCPDCGNLIRSCCDSIAGDRHMLWCERPERPAPKRSAPVIHSDNLYHEPQRDYTAVLVAILLAAIALGLMAAAMSPLR